MQHAAAAAAAAAAATIAARRAAAPAAALERRRWRLVAARGWRLVRCRRSAALEHAGARAPIGGELSGAPPGHSARPVCSPPSTSNPPSQPPFSPQPRARFGLAGSPTPFLLPSAA